MSSKHITFTSFLLIIFSLFLNVTSVDIDCEFSNESFDEISGQYSCSVQNDLNIYDPNTAIESIQGIHRTDKSNEDVTGISIRDKKIHYLPKNLVEKFNNLIAIRLREGRLKEINQKDLKPFTKLRYLNLDVNDIEILEDDLFKFNPLLEVIWLENNQIKTIGNSVFDHLTKLRDLDLTGNRCISLRAMYASQIPVILSDIKTKCFNEETELTKYKKEVRKLTEQNSELLEEIEKLKTENSQPSEDEDKSENKTPTTLIIIGLALIFLLTIANIVFALRFYRAKTVVLKPVELDGFSD